MDGLDTPTLRISLPGRAALLLLTLLAGCGSEPPELVPLRLVEQTEGVEVVRLRRARARAPHWLKEATIGTVSAPGQLANVPMFIPGVPDVSGNRDSRLALLAPTDTVYRYALHLPAAPMLRLGLGYVIRKQSVGRTVDYTVVVHPVDGDAETVLARTLTVEEDGGWQDLEIDLAPWADEDIVLELTTVAATGSVVWAAWAAPEIVRREAVQNGWDVVLISLDTLRADRLGCYGYQRRPTSPAIDAFAASGALFATAVSQAPWTRPSHRALFSGLYPASQGGLSSPPLAEVLWRNGYRTGAITAGGQLDFRFGFHAGFESYRIHDWIRSLDRVTSWLDDADGRRSFLFLHTYEIHDPYTHHTFARAEGLPPGRIRDSFSRHYHESWRKQLREEEKAYVDALYDGGIAFVDEILGRLFGQLEASGVLKRAIVILTSDHGEELWEHGGWRHGAEMYEHQIRVPFIVHLPAALRRAVAADGPAVIAEQVQMIDLYPTLLDLLGLPLTHTVQGRSLVPLLAGETLPPQGAFSENTNIQTFERKSLRLPRYKLVHTIPKGEERKSWPERWELFDLRADPGEEHNAAEQQPEILTRMRARLSEIVEGAGELETEVPADVDPELRQQLEALGYVGN